MTLSRRSFTLVATLGALTGSAFAEDKWPSKPITYIVPFPAGGTTDVLAAAKAKQPLNAASAGSGTSQHLALELLKAKAGVDITHIPYKGSGPAIQDVIAGQVDMLFDTTVVAGPHIESGKLRALAVSSAKRVPALPNAPAGTPKPLVDKLHAEIGRILKEPDMQEHIAELGMQGADMTVEQIALFQQAEVAKWAAVIKSANIKLE